MNEIYKFLKENKLTDLDESAFLSKYSTPEKAAEIHAFFSQNQLTQLDNAAFYDKYLKKKEPTQGAGVPSGSVSPLLSSADTEQVGGTFSDVAKQTAPKRQAVLPLKSIEDRVQESAARLQQEGALAAGGFADVMQQVQPLEDAMPTSRPVNASMAAAAGGFGTPLSNLARQDAGKEIESSEIGVFENLANNFLNGVERLIQQDVSFVTRGTAVASGLPIEAADVMAELNRLSVAQNLKADRQLKTREQMSLFEESTAAFFQSSPIMLSSIGTGTFGFKVAGKAGMRVLGSLPIFMSGYESGIEEANEAGIKDPIAKHTFALTTAGIETGAELIMPDAQLLKPLKKKLLKEVIEQGAKGLTKKQIATYMADATIKVASEVTEELAVEFGNFLRDYSFYLAGQGEMPEMKEGRDYAVIALSAAIGGGAITGLGTSFNIANAKNAAIKTAASNVEVTQQAVAEMLDSGVLTENQASEFMDKVVNYAAAKEKMPSNLDADVAVESSPLVLEVEAIDAQIAALEVEKAKSLEAFRPAIDAQIEALNQQKEALNERIQQIISPTETATNQEAGIATGEDAGGVGVAGEGVQAAGVESLVGKRVSFTDANGNLVEGDAYMDGQRFVVESGGRIYDIFGTLEELNNMESLPMQEVQPRVIINQDGSYTYNSDAGAMPLGTKITPQGAGLKSVKRDKNGVVKSVVVKTDDGKTFNLKGEDANAMAYELMMGEIAKGNLDAKIVLNEEFANRVNTAVAGQAQQATGAATQAAPQQADGTATTSTQGRDGGGKINEKASTQKPLLEGVRDGGQQEQGRQESAQLRAQEEVTPQTETEVTDANEITSPTEVPVGEQPESGQGVREQDTKEQATAKAEKVDIVAERIAKAKEKRKAAMDTLKKQWEESKKLGVATGLPPQDRKQAEANLAKMIKDNKDFARAVKDIVQSNIEIGALKLADSINDITELLGGVKINAGDRKAIEGIFNKEVIAELKRNKEAEFEREVVRDAMKEYIADNRKELNSVANAQALKLVNEAETMASFRRAIEYTDKLITNAEFREAVSEASAAIKGSRGKLSGLGVGKSMVDFFAGLKVTALDDVELMRRMAIMLKVPKEVTMAQIQQLADDVQAYLNEAANNVQKPKEVDVVKRINGLLQARERDAEGAMQDVDKVFDTPAKIRNLAKAIANIEAQIYDIDGITEDRQQELIDSLDDAKEALTQAQSQAVEAVAAFTEENKQAAKALISGITSGEIEVKPTTAQALGVDAMAESLDQIDGLDYYQSQKLVDGLQQIANGFTPLGFFRSVAVDVLNAPQREALVKADEQVDSVVKKAAKEFSEQGGFMGFANELFKKIGFDRSPKISRARLEVEFLTRGFANIDRVLNMWQSLPIQNNFWVPLNKAMDSFRNEVDNSINKYIKESGRSRGQYLSDKIFGGGVKSRNKVGFALLQASENAARGKYNLLQETNKFYASNNYVETGVPTSQVEAVKKLAEEYPNGISYSDLNAKEKKMYDAARAHFDNVLQPRQEMASISNGESFDPLINYAPFIKATGIIEFGKVGSAEVKQETDAMMSGGNNVVKNPKIMSDRGLQRSMNAPFFPVIGDVDSMIGISTTQVMKQYHLQPTLYAAAKAMNAVRKDKNSVVVAAIHSTYKSMVNTELSGYTSKWAKAASNVLGVFTATQLQDIFRTTGEVVTGGFAYASLMDSVTGKLTLPNAGINRKINEIFGASMLQKSGVLKDNTIKNRMQDFYETMTSPDAINTSVWRQMFFTNTLKQQFKLATGENLEYDRLNDDLYIEANKKGLQQAYDATMSRMASIYTNSRLGKPVAIRLKNPITGSVGAFAGRDQGELSRIANAYLMNFGRYAADMGNQFSTAISSGNEGVHSEKVSAARKARIFASTIAQGALYSSIIDLTRVGANYLLADDDDEKQRIWDDYTSQSLSLEKGVLASIGALMYFGLGPYGAFGKAIGYASMYAAHQMLEMYYKWDRGMTKGDWDNMSRSINRVSQAVFYKGQPKNERDFNNNLMQIASGGVGFAVSEASGLLEMGSDIMRGDANAYEAWYAAGFVWNATVGRKLNLPFPYAETFAKASRDVQQEVKDAASPEKIAKAYSRDRARVNGLVKNFAIQTYYDEVTKGNPNALKENKQELSKALEKVGVEGVKRQELIKRMEDKYNESKLPNYMYAIKKMESPKAAAKKAAEEYERLTKDLDRAMAANNGQKMRELNETISVFRSFLNKEKKPTLDSRTENKIQFQNEFSEQLRKRGLSY